MTLQEFAIPVMAPESEVLKIITEISMASRDAINTSRLDSPAIRERHSVVLLVNPSDFNKILLHPLIGVEERISTMFGIEGAVNCPSYKKVLLPLPALRIWYVCIVSYKGPPTCKISLGL